MALNKRNHTVPGPTDQPSLAGILAALESVNDIVPVANATQRDEVAAAIKPTRTRPLVVSRGDAPPGGELEMTTNGAVWRTIPAGANLWRSMTHNTGRMISNSTYMSFSGWNSQPGDPGNVTGGIQYSNGIFTVPLAGRYHVAFAASFTANKTGLRACALNTTENDSGALARDIKPANEAAHTTLFCEYRGYLAAGANVHPMVYQNSGATLQMSPVTGMTRLSIAYEGPA